MTLKININTKSILEDILEYLFLIILVLNCNSIWTSYEGTQINKILELSIFIVTFLYLIVNPNFTYRQINCIALFAFFAVGYFVIYTLIVGYQINSFLYFLIDTFCIYVFVMILNKNKRGLEALYKYERIILIVAIVALFFWLFGSITNVIHPTGVVYSTWTGNDSIKSVPTYYNIYFETQKIYGIVRNTAIFTEAPMYNFHLCICLLIELFCRSKVSKTRCAIILVSILTSISFTGYCIIVIAFAFKYIFSSNSSSFAKNLRIYLIPLVLLIGFVLIWNLVMSKLNSGSGNTRIDDFVAGFKAWTTNPLFGTGFGNNSVVKQYMSSFRSNNQGFSNSFMRILYQGGVFLMIPYVYFAIKWIRTYMKTKNAPWFFLFICFAVIFAVTLTPYNFLPIFIFMMYDFGEQINVKDNQRSYQI